MSVSSREMYLRIDFLQNAAKLLASKTPSTASYLASESIQLELAHRQQDKPFEDHQRQTFCTACGNIFVPGWNCSIVRGDKKKSPASHKQKTIRRGTVIYKCQRCHHDTALSIHPTEKLRNVDHENQISGSTTTTVTKKTSSKKRAKARKDQAGLQALLERSKEEKNKDTSPKLSLMDLMMH